MLFALRLSLPHFFAADPAATTAAIVATATAVPTLPQLKTKASPKQMNQNTTATHPVAQPSPLGLVVWFAVGLLFVVVLALVVLEERVVADSNLSRAAASSAHFFVAISMRRSWAEAAPLLTAQVVLLEASCS